MPSLCRTQHPDSSRHAAAGEGCLFTQVQQLRDDSASDEQVVLAMTEVLGPWPVDDGYIDQVSNSLHSPSAPHRHLCMRTPTPMHVAHGRPVLFVPRANLTDTWLLLGPTMACFLARPCGSSQQAPAFGMDLPQGRGPNSHANAAAAGLHLWACPIWLHVGGQWRLFLSRCCRAIQFPTRLSERPQGLYACRYAARSGKTSCWRGMRQTCSPSTWWSKICSTYQGLWTLSMAACIGTLSSAGRLPKHCRAHSSVACRAFHSERWPSLLWTQRWVPMTVLVHSCCYVSLILLQGGGVCQHITHLALACCAVLICSVLNVMLHGRVWLHCACLHRAHVSPYVH